MHFPRFDSKTVELLEIFRIPISKNKDYQCTSYQVSKAGEQERLELDREEKKAEKSNAGLSEWFKAQ